MVGLEYHKAPEVYLKSILGIDEIEDSNESRHSKNMQIAEYARSST
jgi:hypothetical protein